MRHAFQSLGAVHIVVTPSMNFLPLCASSLRLKLDPTHAVFISVANHVRSVRETDDVWRRNTFTSTSCNSYRMLNNMGS